MSIPSIGCFPFNIFTVKIGGQCGFGKKKNNRRVGKLKKIR
jgi:hypothetical protein